MSNHIKPISEFWNKATDRYFKRNKQMQGFPMPWPNMPFRVRMQELTIWSGYSGHGKSAFLSLLALQQAAHGQKTVIASFEMPADQTAARMIKQALGTSTANEFDVERCKEWMSQYIYIYDYVGRVTSQGGILKQFEEAHANMGITQFQIDSLLKCGMNEDDYNGQKHLLEELHNFAMTNDSHVHMVAHSRKGEDEYRIPGKMDVAHSGSINQLCNNGMTVWRNKRKEEELAEGKNNRRKECDAIVWCWKSRECGPEEEGKTGLYYHHPSIQYLYSDTDAPTILNGDCPF